MKTNLMKNILHLKEDTEYQIPLRESDIEKDDKKIDRVKAGVVSATEAEVERTKDNADRSQEGDAEAEKKADEISQEEVNNEEGVNNENDPALDNLEEENPNQEHPNTEESNSDTTTESVPQVDTAKAALDEMKKLASQEGVIHPSLFISNFSKILGLMERAMQLQVKESGSATEEKVPETNKQTETPHKG